MSQATTDPQPSAKPAISPARSAASRANGARSRGPKTEAGKERSRLNGLTHGLSAQLAILPGEDPEALQQRLDTWTDELGAETDAERYLVANAVHASWRMDRCRNSEAAALTRQVLDAEAIYDDEKAQEVADLADRLADDPDGVVRQLRQSSAGCAWLIAQWQVLDARLKGWKSLEQSQRCRGISLMGRRAVELFVDPRVTRWTAAQVGALYGNVGVEAAKVARYLERDRPETMSPVEFSRHVEQLCAGLPDMNGGQALLRQSIAEALAELAERAELVALREERDRALAVECASFDAGRAGASRLRYEMAHERSLRAALRELRALQKMRREQGDSTATGPDDATADAPTEPRPPADAPTEPRAASDLPRSTTPRAEVVAPSEPKATGPLAATLAAGTAEVEPALQDTAGSAVVVRSLAG